MNELYELYFNFNTEYLIKIFNFHEKNDFKLIILFLVDNSISTI